MFLTDGFNSSIHALSQSLLLQSHSHGHTQQALNPTRLFTFPVRKWEKDNCFQFTRLTNLQILIKKSCLTFFYFLLKIWRLILSILKYLLGPVQEKQRFLLFDFHLVPGIVKSSVGLIFFSSFFSSSFSLHMSYWASFFFGGWEARTHSQSCPAWGHLEKLASVS